MISKFFKDLIIKILEHPIKVVDCSIYSKKTERKYLEKQYKGNIYLITFIRYWKDQECTRLAQISSHSSVPTDCITKLPIIQIVSYKSDNYYCKFKNRSFRLLDTYGDEDSSRFKIGKYWYTFAIIHQDIFEAVDIIISGTRDNIKNVKLVPVRYYRTTVPKGKNIGTGKRPYFIGKNWLSLTKANQLALRVHNIKGKNIKKNPCLCDDYLLIPFTEMIYNPKGLF